MIYASEGAASPYYAGLNLVLIVACLMMPYTFKERWACAWRRSGVTWSRARGITSGRPSTQLPIGVLFSNVYFISLTTLICVTASAHTAPAGGWRISASATS